MRASVCIGYRPDGGPRDRAWGWVRARYLALHPGYEVIAADAEGNWSRARSLNKAVDLAEADVLVLADADCALERGALREAVRHCRTWSIPYTRLARLSGPETDEVLMTDPISRLAQFQGEPFTGAGGIVVVRRELLEAIGGFDPRFEGWGGEDNWLRFQLTKRAGPARMVEGTLVHLWHPRPPSRREGAAYRRNVRLMDEARDG